MQAGWRRLRPGEAGSAAAAGWRRTRLGRVAGQCALARGLIAADAPASPTARGRPLARPRLPPGCGCSILTSSVRQPGDDAGAAHSPRPCCCTPSPTQMGTVDGDGTARRSCCSRCLPGCGWTACASCPCTWWARCWWAWWPQRACTLAWWMAGWLSHGVGCTSWASCVGCRPHRGSGSAAQIVLTQVVPRERLVEAHAKNALASSGAEVVGPGLAGLLIKLLGRAGGR